MAAKNPKIQVTKDGPYLVSGGVPLKELVIVQKGHTNAFEEGRVFPEQESYALCRCGKTKTPPFCDGSHVHNHFDGTETASRAAFTDRAELQEGPGLDLLDDNRCTFARFCHKAGGSVWDLIDQSDDPEARAEAMEAAEQCPAGRLVALYKDGTPLEYDYEPTIALMQDPEKNCSAGLFVMGGIPVESADGETYEVRNRVALCRCGHSRNKPFCDAMHVPSEYHDGLKKK